MKLDRVIAVRNNKTIYRDGDRAIKVFGADYSKADVLNEALNQARIEETGLNIPRNNRRSPRYEGGYQTKTCGFYRKRIKNSRRTPSHSFRSAQR